MSTQESPPDGWVHVITVWPIAPHKANDDKTKGPLSSISEYIRESAPPSWGSSGYLSTPDEDAVSRGGIEPSPAPRPIGRDDIRLVIPKDRPDVVAQYPDVDPTDQDEQESQLSESIMKDIHNATVGILLARGRGLALVLDVCLEPSTSFKRLTVIKKALFDPGVEVEILGVRLSRGIPEELIPQESKELIPQERTPNEGAQDSATGKDEHEVIRRSLLKRAESHGLAMQTGTDLLVVPDQIVRVPQSSWLYGLLLKGARTSLVTQGTDTRAVRSRTFLLQLIYKDSSLTYEPEYSPHLIPEDANALEGMTVAVRDRDIVVLGLDRYFAYLPKRAGELVVAAAQVRCAEALVDDLTEHLRVWVASKAEAVEGALEGGVTSSSLSDLESQLQFDLRLLAQVQTDFEAAIGEVNSLASVEGGAPSRSVVHSLVEQSGLRLKSDQLSQLADTASRLVDMNQRTVEQKSRERLRRDGDTVKLVVIVFAVISATLAAASLWAATLAVPTPVAGKDSFSGDALRAASLALGVLAGGALIGTVLWWLATKEARKRANWRLAVAVVLQLGVLTSALVLLWPQATQTWIPENAGDTTFELAVLLVGTALFVVSLWLVSRWLTRDEPKHEMEPGSV